MREVVYAGGSFITSDAIAETLLEYAAQLANADRAANVHVPALDEFGQPFDISVVIGPASQLLSEPVINSAADPDGDGFIADVTQRMRDLRRSWPTTPFDRIEWEL
ncbi:MAG TPA: hypothetical protein VL294_03265 [Pseudolysinimonas sp.]|jgi:hypothetical protein|nr:hypothetical protein [Pseudolysinimonas sp.]